MALSDSLLTLSLALAAEAAFGYPHRLYTWIGHPVTWIGRLIKGLDRSLNRETRSFGECRAAGILALLILLTMTGLAAWILEWLFLPLGIVGLALLALLSGTLIAQRSLHEHVAAVSEGLRDSGLDGGRRAVSMIVGRNPQSLDEAGVSRAAIESLAENFSDGIVAPAFWIGVGGLTGGALYKAANTADSMIGHRTPRHEAFGWAAARFDDLVNLPASRLTALLIVAAAALHQGASARNAWRAVLRDASHHRSPNAGWSEAAMAGALGLRLAGPRVYGDVRIEDRWMGDGRAEANADDIDRALGLYRTACLLLFALAAGATLLTWIIAR
ncbi:adenosylcobinamide-phosphate synthase CbiB [Microvirga lotononidis]|uniref:Cobalamin biosynthesis protein CobD n=1 Tax=Microvirga lotononidis TaxID=864069 RepID=I4YWU7_9HYPH|nr:adenosylcobinamide-phosphate synthase CbiB [Microvirga lotononidis]EIM28439.1 cobalamin biosynthesis protein CobD [Microvirga lotononidis]WQO27482.1 adenosylcobinamide-phosphate synthase CbiB [Microvirga lotononidis]